MKLIGCVLIVLGFAGCGFYGAFAYRAEIELLRCLYVALQHMAAQLKYKLLPLPALLSDAASTAKGKIGELFLSLSAELDRQSCPDVKTCLAVVLARESGLPKSVRDSMTDLSHSLGKFDLDGQLQGLEYMLEHLKEKLLLLEQDKTLKVQLARTVGICAGIGLAIILF